MDESTFNTLFNMNIVHQRTYDFHWVVNEVEKIKPKTIIEVGLGNGGSLKFWEFIILQSGYDNKTGTIISLESNPSLYPTWDWKNSKVDIYIIHGDSTDINIISNVKQILGDKKVDFLFIDGGHRYSVPEKDFNNYSPFVRERGIICIADLGEPCPAHVFLQLPEPREVDPTIGMGIWRKQSGDIKTKLCNNQGESTGEAYKEILDIFRFRVPNPP